MNWKSFLTGVSVGIISGFLASEWVSQKGKVSPEKALTHAKAKFKERGPISGSWIQMTTEPYEKNNITYDVYKGGVSRTVDDTLEQYEFISDAKTGSILEVYPL